jgi:hypothetical protein
MQEIEARLAAQLDACAPQTRPQIWCVRGYRSWVPKEDGGGGSSGGGSNDVDDEAGGQSAMFAALQARLDQTEQKLRLYQASRQ